MDLYKLIKEERRSNLLATGKKMPPAFGTADALATLGGLQGVTGADLGPSMPAVGEMLQLKPPGEWRVNPSKQAEPPGKSSVYLSRLHCL